MKNLLIISSLLLLGLNGFGQVDSTIQLKFTNYSIVLDKYYSPYDEFGDSIMTRPLKDYKYAITSYPFDTLQTALHTRYSILDNENGFVRAFEDSVDYVVASYIGEIEKDSLLKMMIYKPILIIDYAENLNTNINFNFYVNLIKEGSFVQISRGELNYSLKMDTELRKLKIGDIVMLEGVSYSTAPPYYIGSFYWKLK
ncbi:MAG: hypothetical protein HRT73_11350 [Flavobacteriales bacterium]|nr:hypothetical protein [Flavobacteriales bacterium]